MLRLRYGTVVSLGESRPGAVECQVDVDGTLSAALAYPDLIGEVSVGDTVLLNVSAVELGLGTGGFHLVVAVRDGPGPTDPFPGRIVKARYTPLQTVVGSVEETDGEVLEASNGLTGAPVVVAPLHSMVAAIAAGAKVAGGGKVVYVMTDGAALPAAFSKLIPRMKEAGLVEAVITCGQAFGGDLEAVTVWSAMLAAREVLDADAIVVADGPGSVGTATRWGAGALEGGNVLNAVEALGGRAVAALRVSFADARDRHRGVSHHSLTLLREVARIEANVAVPVLDEPQRRLVWDELKAAGLDTRHRLIEVPGELALRELEERGLEVTSMGRGISEDPAFFLAAGGAGILAGRMAARSFRPPRA